MEKRTCGQSDIEISVLYGDRPAADDKADLEREVNDALDLLGERERIVIMDTVINGLTLRRTGEKLGITFERVRQIRDKALRRLRHPYRANRFREWSRFHIN